MRVRRTAYPNSLGAELGVAIDKPSAQCGLPSLLLRYFSLRHSTDPPSRRHHNQALTTRRCNKPGDWPVSWG
jgi:hypothetical protein